jgi:putative endopeptidase
MKTRKNYKKNNISKKKKEIKIDDELNKRIFKIPNLKKEFTNDLARVHDLKKIFTDAYNHLLRDDYYSFVDKIWQKNIKITKEQEYIVEVDDFRLVQHKVYQQLNNIIINIIETNSNKESSYIKKFYNSSLHLLDQKTCMNYAKEELNVIDNFRKDPTNVWKLLGYMNRNEMYASFCPLYWKVSQDLKNVNKMQSYISSTVFTLVDVNLYFDDGTNVEYKKKCRKELMNYINNVFECAFGKKHTFNIKDVFDIEVQLVNAFGCPGIKTSSDIYNKVYKEDSIKKYNFDWNEFSKNIGFSRTPDFFIAQNLSYLKCTSEILLNEWNSEKWRTYWIYIYIRQLTRFSIIGRNYYGDFYAKIIKKANILLPLNLGAVILTTYAFNNLITNEYVEKYSIPEDINYVKNLANELKKIFIKIIGHCKWLQPKTKEYALLKLKHFKFYIAETEEHLPDPLLNYKEDDLWYNLTILADYRLKLFINLNNKKPENIAILDWKTTPISFINLQPYIVNASYTPSKNAITIPVSYIQKPFINLSAQHSFSYNLAHIGFTIGHEMSHALDDWGSQYDYKGNLNDWWTKEDKRQYKIIQNKIINQYEEWAKRDGIIFDASKTIGEDLADISGLTTVIEYYTDYLADMNEFPPIIDISLKTLFIFFAYQMRQFETKRALTYQLEENVHPPNKYRVNIPLSRTPAYRLIYNITEKDDMYWKSTDRVWMN